MNRARSLGFSTLRLVTIIFFFASSEQVEADSFALNLYGVSYHLDHRDEPTSGMGGSNKLNEFNEGVGLRLSLGNDSSDVLFLEGGSFQDSFENEAGYLSLGYQWRVIMQLRIGINAAIYATDSIREGDPFFAAIPLISYTIGFLTVNGLYLPKYRDINPYHTIGAYLTIRLFDWKRNGGQ
ncbi:MAG: hypothetical protein NTW07_11695 [candidate division Zixibacteria bacterium]|nr:hypothetical protein [candidate division Zixibacteria bacterium]